MKKNYQFLPIIVSVAIWGAAIIGTLWAGTKFVSTTNDLVTSLNHPLFWALGGIVLVLLIMRITRRY